MKSHAEQEKKAAALRQKEAEERAAAFLAAGHQNGKQLSRTNEDFSGGEDEEDWHLEEGRRHWRVCAEISPVERPFPWATQTLLPPGSFWTVGVSIFVIVELFADVPFTLPEKLFWFPLSVTGLTETKAMPLPPAAARHFPQHFELSEFFCVKSRTSHVSLFCPSCQTQTDAAAVTIRPRCCCCVLRSETNGRQQTSRPLPKELFFWRMKCLFGLYFCEPPLTWAPITFPHPSCLCLGCFGVFFISEWQSILHTWCFPFVKLNIHIYVKTHTNICYSVFCVVLSGYCSLVNIPVGGFINIIISWFWLQFYFMLFCLI